MLVIKVRQSTPEQNAHSEQIFLSVSRSVKHRRKLNKNPVQ